MPTERDVALVAITAALTAFACWLSNCGEGNGRKAEKPHGKPQQPAVLQDYSSAARVKQQPKRNKGAERLEWWQRVNEVKPELVLPPPQSEVAMEVPNVHTEVSSVAHDRLGRGKDWLVRDSDYGDAPAHSAVKSKVNTALVQAVSRVFGDNFANALLQDPCKILLLLDTPQYGTLRHLVESFPGLRCSQQVVIPQADLRHYFEMVRKDKFYPGVRAQRLDHWLCANANVGLQCVAAFLDFECRLVGACSARLCPAADVMSYFRFNYPAESSILALTVGLEEPAATPELVDEFVKAEAKLNGYTAELIETWKYRMVTLLYIVRKFPSTKK